MTHPAARPPRPPRVSDLVAALEGFPRGEAIRGSVLDIRAILPDGRWRHLRIENGGIRMQPEARAPVGIPAGERCGPCPHLLDGEGPRCLLLDVDLEAGSSPGGPDKACGADVAGILP